MKISAQEEYGLRCLLQLARADVEGESLTLSQIARREGISVANAGKLMFSGVAERFPRIRWVLGHLGGAIPYLAERLDQGGEVHRAR